MSEVIIAGVSGLKISTFKEDSFDEFAVSMRLTTDTEIDNSKTYYTLSEGNYLVVSTPVVTELSTYYEPVFGSGHENHFRDGATWHGDHYTESDPNYKPGLIDGYKALSSYEIKDEQGQSYNPPRYSYPRSPEDSNFAEYAEQFKDYDSINTPHGIKAGTLTLPPTPSTVMGATAGYYAEKPCYLPTSGSKESVIFPISSGACQLYGYKSSTYLPLSGSDKMTTAAVSAIPSKDYDNTTTNYAFGGYQKELTYTYEGSCPYSNNISNILTLPESKSWASYWKPASSWVTPTTTTVTAVADINPVLATDGLAISPTTGYSDAFIYEFTPTADTTYSISAYVRCPNSTTYMYFPVICDTNLTPLTDSHYVCNRNSTTLSTVGGELIQVTDKWQRIGSVVSVTAGTTYKVFINWPLGYTVGSTQKTNNRSVLKIAGLLMTEGSRILPYDSRVVNKQIESVIHRPAIFNVDTPMNNALSKPTTTGNNWTIIYDRRIFDNPELGNRHIDRLGKYKWGYVGNKIYTSDGTTETEEEGTYEPAGVDINDFYNTVETVILQHSKSAKTLTITTYAQGRQKEGITESVDYFKHTEVISNVTTIDNLSLNDVVYQLQLGGEDVTASVGDCYRCLTLIPFAITTDDIVNRYMALSEIDVQDSRVTNPVMMRNHYIEEGV